MFGSPERHFAFPLQNERLSGGILGGKYGWQQQRYQREHNTQCEAATMLGSQHVRAAECYCYLSVRCITYMYTYKIVAILL